MGAEIHVGESKTDAGAKLAQQILGWSQRAIQERGYFTVAFSGGSMPDILAKGFDELDQEQKKNLKQQTPNWHVFYSDERCVDLESPDSNHNACSCALYQKDYFATPQENFHTISQDSSQSTETKAKLYEEQLLKVVKSQEFPSIDAILIGMGPDGHTASLFPNHELLENHTKWILPITDSPKPPSDRITFSVPLIRNGRNVAVLACGASKQDPLSKTVKNLQEHKSPDPSLPVTYVKPEGNKIQFFVDKDAYTALEE